MKKILPVPFVISVYFTTGYIYIYGSLSGSHIPAHIAGLLLLATVIFSGAGNILYMAVDTMLAVSSDHEGRIKSAADAMILMKLIMMPCSSLNFTAMLFLYLFHPGAAGAFPLSFTVIPLTFFIMAATSAFSVSALIIYRKAGRISAGRSRLHAVLQFILVADVIDSIYLFYLMMKECSGILRPGAAFRTAALSVIAAAAAIIPPALFWQGFFTM